MTLALGLNQTAYNYYGQDMPFLDLMKGAHDWSGTLNQYGYPVSAPGRVGSLVPMEGTSFRNVTVTKKGTIKLAWAGGPGHTENQWTQPVTGTGGSANMLAEGFNAADPVSSITVARAEYQALLDAGQIVAPDYAARMKAFKALRFMDWMKANGQHVVTPATPPAKLTDRSWDGPRGVPIEAIIAVANATRTDPWLNVPHNATDAEAMALFGMVKAKLAPGLTAIVEYSNELWNQNFPQSAAVLTLAAGKWGAGAPRERWTGFRTGQLAVLARGYGFKFVGGVQTVQPGQAKGWWQGYAESGATDADMKGWTSTVYIAGTLTDRNQASFDLVASGNVDAAIANLRSTGPLSVAGMTSFLQQQGAVAKAHGLAFFAYECNLHLNCQGFPDIPKAIAFYSQVQNDPRAGDVMDEALKAFEAAGGSLAMMFASSGPGQTIGGNFGLTKGLSDTVGLPVWQMMQRRLAAAQAPVVTPLVVTPPVVTPPVVPPVVPPATPKASPEVVSAIKALYDMVTTG